MNCSQFPHLELADNLSKIKPIIIRKKTLAVIIYLLVILYLSIPSFNIPYLSYGSVRFTSLMEQRAMERYMLFYPRQSWVNIENINPLLLKAVISMEDGKFFSHKGIDWKELNTSLRINKRRGRTVRGASTITMQLSKNLYLTTRKSFFRKAKEFIIALRMEKELSKKTILENYVNVIEWGEDIFGVKKAAEEYYNKEPENLNANESSRLAAVIPSPLRHTPLSNSGYVNRRAGIIRARLNDVELFLNKKQ